MWKKAYTIVNKNVANLLFKSLCISDIRYYSSEGIVSTNIKPSCWEHRIRLLLRLYIITILEFQILASKIQSTGWCILIRTLTVLFTVLRVRIWMRHPVRMGKLKQELWIQSTSLHLNTLGKTDKGFTLWVLSKNIWGNLD